MKVILSINLIIGLLFFGNFTILDTNNGINVEKEIPPNAKWGQIAMQMSKEKYNQNDIIDYLHIGKEKGKEYSIEKFKLWLQKDSKEFGVFVYIKFDNVTEKIINIKYKETTK